MVAGDCDDQNACTDDKCNAHSCDYIPNDALCDFDGLDDFYGGLDGICISGVCEENPCDDGDTCTNDWCHPTEGECRTPPVDCSDRNTCTDDTCDAETGECIHTPVPDGQSCCLEWDSNCGFCIPAYPCCVNVGTCQDGGCV